MDEVLDGDRPSSARIYDYILGGQANTQADRDAAEAVLADFPDLRTVMWSNRSFLRRVVKFLVGEAGISQFLDLGSGVPTVGNVHEIAQSINPAARTVYVDIDPVAAAYATRLLTDATGTRAIRADLRDPHAVLSHPDTLATLDFDQPVAILAISVLHFVPDHDDPAAIINTYLDHLVPGSYLALSHATSDSPRDDEANARETYTRRAQPIIARSRETIEHFFDGLQFAPPGLVLLPAWRPDEQAPIAPDALQFGYGGVARLPEHQ